MLFMLMTQDRYALLIDMYVNRARLTNTIHAGQSCRAFVQVNRYRAIMQVNHAGQSCRLIVAGQSCILFINENSTLTHVMSVLLNPTLTRLATFSSLSGLYMN